MRCIKPATLLQVLILAALLIVDVFNATGALTPAAGPVPNALCDYRTTVCLEDEFLSGNTASGAVGSLGWSLSGGSTTTPASEANHPGLVLRDTGAVINTVTSLRLFSGSSGSSAGIDPARPHSVTWIARMNNNDSNVTMRIGEMAPNFTNPPNDGIYIEKKDADTNWFCVTRSGGTETRIDSGVATSTNFIDVAYERASYGVQFKINRTNVCGVMSANIPTTFVNPEAVMNNSAAAAKSFTVDYFKLRITGLVR